MASLRTRETDISYTEYQTKHRGTGCQLCQKPALKLFKHWKIVENSFPYDRIAEVHNMIVPLRHIIEQDLNFDELQELYEIKRNIINKDYEFTIEATYKVKSIPTHFHLHLIVTKS